MHGQETRLTANLVYGNADAVCQPDVHDYPNHTLREAFITARQNLGRATRRRKAYYDLRAQPAAFQPGSWVRCLVPKRVSGQYQKWRSLYQ